MHYNGDILHYRQFFIILSELCLLLVHSIVMSFKLLEIPYMEEGFHVGITHIILRNKNLPVYDAVVFSLWITRHALYGGFDWHVAFDILLVS